MITLFSFFLNFSFVQPLCIPCESRETILDLNFTDVPHSWFNGGPNSRWTSSPGVESELNNSGLVLSANPYTEWSSSPNPFYFDHDKGNFKLNQVFTDPNLYFEVEMKGETFGTELNPFPADMTAENDLRLANCGVCLTMPNQLGFNRYMLLLTNDRIYAVLEYTLTISFVPNGIFGALFTVPVAKRVPDQWHRLGLLITQPGFATNFQISIDGSKPFSPFPLTDLQNLIVIFNGPIFLSDDALPLELSFGHFTFLDAYSPCKDSDVVCGPTDQCIRSPVNYGLVKTGIAYAYNDPAGFPFTQVDAQYWDSLGTDQDNHIWGQGSELTIRRLLVRRITSGCDANF